MNKNLISNKMYQIWRNGFRSRNVHAFYIYSCTCWWKIKLQYWRIMLILIWLNGMCMVGVGIFKGYKPCCDRVPLILVHLCLSFVIFYVACYSMVKEISASSRCCATNAYALLFFQLDPLEKDWIVVLWDAGGD